MPKTRKSPSPSPKVKKSPAAGVRPTNEEIALRAYHIYLERNGAPGNPLEDWARAERELLGAAPKPRRKPAPKSIAA